MIMISIALDRKKSGAFFLPGKQKGGDTVAKKMSLEELAVEKGKAEREIKIAKQNLRILAAEKKGLTRRERMNRLRTHGAMLEQYLNPEVFTDDKIEEILRTIFRWNDVIVYVNDVAKRSKLSEVSKTS